MKIKPASFLLIGVFLSSVHSMNAADLFVSLQGSGLPPYGDWSAAATNIQDAIDAATDGDTVWVTNGVYSAGGKVMVGDLTNRVALDKALTVRSVNGPFVTRIIGNGATNGPNAVRCAWLTNGATLKGFTLTAGATRTYGNQVTLLSGGAVWCASSNALVAECIIATNQCAGLGSGAYQGTLRSCYVSGNKWHGAYAANLVSCTVSSNANYGVFICKVTNSIVSYNTPSETASSTLAFCCTPSFSSGLGNIAANPRFLADGIHLANDSPCRAAGTNLTEGVDIDGEAWANPPSIGCDQWQAAPRVYTAPVVQLARDPAGFSISAAVAGEEPLTFSWYRDGTLLLDGPHIRNASASNLRVVAISPADMGGYSFVASNSLGAVTSTVVQVVGHYVDAGNPAPAVPYGSWETAATNIQDAVDAALAGEFVFVTNGVYSQGGKVMASDLTNRVALDKALMLQSVNGPEVTTIQGSGTTNGTEAVRCAWLTNGAILSGFTLTGGATRVGTSSPDVALVCGGGVWGSSTNATVNNCVIATNLAWWSGGGAYQVAIYNSTLRGNQGVGSGIPGSGVSGAGSGGGAAKCNLQGSVLTANMALQGDGGGAHSCDLRNSLLALNANYMYGGGAYSGTLINCTVTGNKSGGYSPSHGAAVYSAKLTNCIVSANTFNTWQNVPGSSGTNYSFCTFSYCCTAPLPSGVGNIGVDPALIDSFHLSAGSPCIGAGLASVAAGTDLDGEAWFNPPAIGCDELGDVPRFGLPPRMELSGFPPRLNMTIAPAASRQPTTSRWHKNGVPLEDDATHYNGAGTTNLVATQFGPADAGSYLVVASNSFGMATSAVARVTVHCADAASASPVAPYSDWKTAAGTIQDAVDAASEGDIVLVTNGVYASGGTAIYESHTNRVAITKPLLVTSINGPEVTVIQGAWDPQTTNGPLAVRSAWIVNGARLAGVTLTGGATLNTGDVNLGQSGGGLYSPPPAGYDTAVASPGVYDCVISNNTACSAGGGAFRGTFYRCRLLANRANQSGGGAFQGTYYGCYLGGNLAGTSGGGAHSTTFYNCTVSGNRLGGLVPGTAGVYSCSVYNSIVYQNYCDGSPSWPFANYSVSTFANSCSTPQPTGSGNISADPQLLDFLHLKLTSPCRGKGSARYATGTDIDGEAWAPQPAMGADEVWEAALVGPLSVSVRAGALSVTQGRYLDFTGQFSGRVSRLDWSFGDGIVLTNSMFAAAHQWATPGDYVVTFTAFNLDHPEGVSASVPVNVIPFVVPVLSSSYSQVEGLQLSFDGQPRVMYLLQSSTNVADPAAWRTVTSYSGTGAPVTYTDRAMTNQMLFYRLSVLPL